MTRLLKKAMNSAKLIASRFQRVLDPPLGPSARPLEIRRAILERIEGSVEPIGNGRRGLPGEVAVVSVLVVGDSARRAIRNALADLPEAVAERLRELRCVVKAGFDVELELVDAALPGWVEDQRFDVAFRVGASRGHRAERTTMPVLRIRVDAGSASKASYVFVEPIVRIGRSDAPTDERGHRVTNQIAFADDGGPENKTVTRLHAEIRFHGPTGEYRLFDVGSVNGTMIIRNGSSISVPPHDPVGVSILAGDEIHVGRGVLKVQLGSQRGL